MTTYTYVEILMIYTMWESLYVFSGYYISTFPLTFLLSDWKQKQSKTQSKKQHQQKQQHNNVSKSVVLK